MISVSLTPVDVTACPDEIRALTGIVQTDARFSHACGAQVTAEAARAQHSGGGGEAAVLPYISLGAGYRPNTTTLRPTAATAGGGGGGGGRGGDTASGTGPPAFPTVGNGADFPFSSVSYDVGFDPDLSYAVRTPCQAGNIESRIAARENTSECRNFEVILKKMMRWCCAVLRCALRCAVLHCAVLQAMLGGLINQGGRTFNSTVGKRRQSY